MLHSCTLIIPAYLEADRLPHTLGDLKACLESGELQALSIQQVIVVDDGSPDATATVAREHGTGLPGFEVLRLSANQGKGGAVRAGAARATGEWTLMADADLSTPWVEGLKLAKQALATQAAVAIGSRDVQGSVLKIRQSRLRETLGRTFNAFVRLISRLPFKDTQCGFKLWRTRPIQKLLPALRTDRFAWDVEWLMFARAAELKTIEVPVVWQHQEGSRVSLWKDGLEMAWTVLKLRFRLLSGRTVARKTEIPRSLR